MREGGERESEERGEKRLHEKFNNKAQEFFVVKHEYIITAR